MPVALTHPGVYVEELPSGMRSITGVATSITAFVGRAKRGPIDDQADSPVRCFSFADFERHFGGLWADSPLSFAVYHYFQNGGAEALIVRVHNGASSASASVNLSGGGSTTFTAANAGTWARQLRLRIDHDIDASVAAQHPANSLFNLRVRDLSTGATETHRNLSTTLGQPRFVGDVLAQGSTLLRGPVATLASRPVANAAPAPNADAFVDASATALTNGSDGNPVTATQVTDLGLRAAKRGLYALERADLFNLLVMPPLSPNTDVTKASWDAAVTYARERRAFVLVDPPYHSGGWTGPASIAAANAITAVAARDKNAALFFPRLLIPNPLSEHRPEPFAPCGAVAGVIARTDAARGVWKSPAGQEATLAGVLAPAVHLTDAEQGVINPLGVNAIRNFPLTGPTLWGARTLVGADALANEWKYLAVRRMALYLEESLYRGTQWVVFEPNDEPLWAQIRLNIGAFLNGLFRQGAFQGKTPKDAYFVRCDASTTTQADINNGIVNIVVGFAPLKPAEFVVLKFQQIAGDIPV